jgi:hypothetical protein
LDEERGTKLQELTHFLDEERETKLKTSCSTKENLVLNIGYHSRRRIFSVSQRIEAKQYFHVQETHYKR